MKTGGARASRPDEAVPGALASDALRRGNLSSPHVFLGKTVEGSSKSSASGDARALA